MTTIVLNALLKPLIEPHLPDWAEVRWYKTKDEAFALASEAEIGYAEPINRQSAAASLTSVAAIAGRTAPHDGAGGVGPVGAMPVRNPP